MPIFPGENIRTISKLSLEGVRKLRIWIVGRTLVRGRCSMVRIWPIMLAIHSIWYSDSLTAEYSAARYSMEHALTEARRLYRYFEVLCFHDPNFWSRYGPTLVLSSHYSFFNCDSSALTLCSYMNQQAPLPPYVFTRRSSGFLRSPLLLKHVESICKSSTYLLLKILALFISWVWCVQSA